MPALNMTITMRPTGRTLAKIWVLRIALFIVNRIYGSIERDKHAFKAVR